MKTQSQNIEKVYQQSQHKTISTTGKVNILGVGISAINQDTALQKIDDWIKNNDKQYISVCTVHTIMECQKNEAVRNAVNRAGMATPDGMPLVWLAGWESEQAVERVYGPDLMLSVCERSVEYGYRHFLLGGDTGVPELLAGNLRHMFPGIQIAGCYSPPFRDLTRQEEKSIIDMINQTEPHVVWIGLGTPKQDLWMAKYRTYLNSPVMIAVGAAFNFHTKRIPQAPKWMQKLGLEWLYRLIHEPGRLWYRYLVYNPLFVMKIIEQKLGLKEYTLDT